MRKKSRGNERPVDRCGRKSGFDPLRMANLKGWIVVLVVDTARFHPVKPDFSTLSTLTAASGVQRGLLVLGSDGSCGDEW